MIFNLRNLSYFIKSREQLETEIREYLTSTLN